MSSEPKVRPISILSFLCFSLTLCLAARSHASALDECRAKGWQEIRINADGNSRRLVWKGPKRPWVNGAIIVLHGGGGKYVDFCSSGKLIQPQIDFTELAINEGFAIFSLDSTNNLVTDGNGLPCGKRFDFSVLGRPNLDLPFIQYVAAKLIPQKRPKFSKKDIFITGLSTGGYMASRAAVELAPLFTAAAPVSSGNPFSTLQDCNENLSKRKSAKGILFDIDTRKQIVERNACGSDDSLASRHWPALQAQNKKPSFRIFHHKKDAIVNLSCMKKMDTALKQQHYPREEPLIINNFGRKRAIHHLWRQRYNQPILDYFKSVSKK